MLAKELMGVSIAPSSGLDAMNPDTPEEFSKFGAALKEKITSLETSAPYVLFLEELFRDICQSCKQNSGIHLNQVAEVIDRLFVSVGSKNCFMQYW